MDLSYNPPFPAPARAELACGILAGTARDVTVLSQKRLSACKTTPTARCERQISSMLCQNVAVAASRTLSPSGSPLLLTVLPAAAFRGFGRGLNAPGRSFVQHRSGGEQCELAGAARAVRRQSRAACAGRRTLEPSSGAVHVPSQKGPPEYQEIECSGPGTRDNSPDQQSLSWLPGLNLLCGTAMRHSLMAVPQLPAPTLLSQLTASRVGKHADPPGNGQCRWVRGTGSTAKDCRLATYSETAPCSARVVRQRGDLTRAGACAVNPDSFRRRLSGVLGNASAKCRGDRSPPLRVVVPFAAAGSLGSGGGLFGQDA